MKTLFALCALPVSAVILLAWGLGAVPPAVALPLLGLTSTAMIRGLRHD